MSWRRPCPSRSRKARGPKERASRLHACRSAQDRRVSCHPTATDLFDRAPHFSTCLVTQTSPHPPPGTAVVMLGPDKTAFGHIGREHVCNPVTTAHAVGRTVADNK